MNINFLRLVLSSFILTVAAIGLAIPTPAEAQYGPQGAAIHQSQQLSAAQAQLQQLVAQMQRQLAQRQAQAARGTGSLQAGIVGGGYAAPANNGRLYAGTVGGDHSGGGLTVVIRPTSRDVQLIQTLTGQNFPPPFLGYRYIVR